MSPEAALVLVRFAHFGAVVLLLGTVVFRRRMTVPETRSVLVVTLQNWELWAAGVALASGVAWLLAETALAADGWARAADPETIQSILTDTLFGNIWVGRLLVSAGLFLIAVFGPDQADWLTEAGAILLAVSLGWIGHGVMRNGIEGDLLAACLGLHVMSVSIWIGALPAVVLCLAHAGSRVPFAAATASLRRFSVAGHLAVATAVITGLVSLRSILGTWALDFSLVYQQLLLIKVALVVFMIGLALANGYWLLPRLSAGSRSARRRLMFFSGLEFATALLVLALVADFGNIAPSS